MKQKVNIQALIISWVLAIIFFVIGIAIIGGGAKKLKVDKPHYNYNVEAGEEYLYKCKVKESGRYYIYVEGGYLDSVERKGGSYQDYTTLTEGSTKRYSVYLYSGDTYILDVECTSYVELAVEVCG